MSFTCDFDYTPVTIRKESKEISDRISERYELMGHGRTPSIPGHTMLGTLRAMAEVKILVCVTMYNESID